MLFESNSGPKKKKTQKMVMLCVNKEEFTCILFTAEILPWAGLKARWKIYNTLN